MWIWDVDTAAWVDSGVTGAIVTSVFGRVGAVVAAASDYDASQVDNDSAVAGAFVDDALNTLNTAVGLNTTHRTSDGSDHTFIDQDVTSGSSPTFDGTNFSLISSEDITLVDNSSIRVLPDGILLFYNNTDKKLYNYRYKNGALHAIDSGTTLRAGVDYAAVNLTLDGKILIVYADTTAVPVDLYFRYKLS